MRRERGSGSLKPRGSIWWLRYMHAAKRVEEPSKVRRTCECSGKETSWPDVNHKMALKMLRQKVKVADTPAHVPPSATKMTLTGLRGLLEADYKEKGRKTFRKIANIWRKLQEH